MTEQPAAPSVKKGSALLRKKVGGVPVLYIAGGFVVILAVYAYTTKAKTGDPTTEVPSDEAVAETVPATLTDGSVYPELPSGSVTGTAQTVPLTNTTIETNDDWIKAGIAFLTKQGMGGGSAQLILQKYLDGQQLSYDEGLIRDKVIRELGPPPTLLPTGGTAPKVIPKLPPVIPKAPPVHPPTKTNPKPVPKDARKYPGHAFKVGSRGHDVTLIQHVVGAKTDGIYGYDTRDKVKAWQTRHNLIAKGVVPGVVGPTTWSAMF